MQGNEKFNAYRRMVASATDGIVCWWYSGMSYIRVPGKVDIPLNQIVAIMTYRTESISATKFRVHWSEIGVFLSTVSGEPSGPWLNPLTGISVQLPQTFQEGPGIYTVTATDAGVQLELEQPYAIIDSLQLDFSVAHDRLAIVQTERKKRGFPLPDGRLPEGNFAPGLTRLAFHAGLDDLKRPARDQMPCTGSYEFTLGTIPPHMGCGDLSGSVHTCGSITKAAPGVRLNERAWELMQARFPREIVDPPAARKAG